MIGDCFNQADSSSVSQSLWVNTTRVVDTNTDGPTWNPLGITPYQRIYTPQDLCFGDPVSCPPDDDCTIQAAGGPGEGTQCGLPPACSFLACTGSDYSLAQSVYHNCYHQTTQSVNYSLCKHIGFKNLVARKLWQGIVGFTDRMNDNYNGYGNWDAFDYCGNNVICGYHAFDSASTTPTKYRTITATCTTVEVQSSGYSTFTVTSTAGGYCTVDRYSGATTSTISSGSSATGDVPSYLDPNVYATYAFQLLGNANNTANIILEAYSSFYATMDNGGTNPPTSISGGGNAWTLVWDNGFGTITTLSIDMSAFTMHADVSSPLDNTYQNWDISCSPTTLHYYHNWNGGCPAGESAGEGDITETVDATLSDPYTSDEVMADWMDLIKNYFDIGNDVLYPFRYKSYENNTNAPLIARDEVMGMVSIGGSGGGDNSATGSRGGTGPDATLYNGSVIGAPNVSASTAFNWDPKYLSWQDCDGALHPHGLGAWSNNFGGVPIASTHWADAFQVHNQIPQGAFLMYNAPELIGGISAEIYGQWQGFNWSRPCGALDRFQLDVTHSNCISSVSSSNTAVFIDPLSFPNNIVGPMTASIWGTGTVDGVWGVNGTSDGTCSLVSLIKSGSDLPFGEIGMWGYASDTTFGAGQICRNRWVGSTPPFCGRVDITKVIQQNPVTISLMEPQQGIINGDKIWIKGCSGTTELNGGTYTLINMGSPYTDFALLGTVSHSTVYIGNGYITTPFPVDYKWNSINSRQNYVIGTYDNNTLRSTGEYWRLTSSVIAGGLQCDGVTPCPITTTIALPTPASPSYTQSCIAFNPCSPNVIAIYPSGSIHTFKHVNLHPFKMNMVLDNRYGNSWQSWVIQSIPDPLWPGNTPCPCRDHLNCNGLTASLGYDCFKGEWDWRNDGGNCLGIQPVQCGAGVDGGNISGVDYFADADRYEAVINVPTGAPPLPAGVDLKQSFVIPTFGNLVYNPWYDTLTKEQCVCSSGRFSQNYMRNGYGCFDQDIPLI